MVRPEKGVKRDYVEGKNDKKNCGNGACSAYDWNAADCMHRK